MSRRTMMVPQYVEFYDGMGQVVAQRYIQHLPEDNRQITRVPLVKLDGARRKVTDFSPLMMNVSHIDFSGASEESLAAWAKAAR